MSPRLPVFLLLALAGFAGADAKWGYTLNRERAQQQANFCSDETEVRQIADVFAAKGPRPGFEALQESKQCALRVATFTPLEIITQVVIAAGEPTEYTVSFLWAQIAGGEKQILVTTRFVTR